MNLQKFIIIISTIIFAYFITLDINIPFVGPNATNFSVYSLIAHNFNKFGYIATKLTPLISVSETYPKTPEYFFHHPTLLSLTQSISFKFFGEEFWTARLPVILFSFGSLFLIYLIGKKILNKKFGIISLVTATLIPASSIFGKMIGQEPLVLFFGLLTVYLTLIFLKTNKQIYFVLSLITAVLSILSDWPGILFILSVLFIYLVNKKIKRGLLLLSTGIITIIFLLIYVYIFREGFWDLKNALLLRSVNGVLNINNWPIIWIGTWITRAILYFNPIIVGLSFIFINLVYKNRNNLKLHFVTILSFLIFGLLHTLIYIQAVYSHNYLIYYFLPFFVFSASFVIYKIIEFKKYFIILILIIYSLIHLVFISEYRKVQIRSNIWRYDFAKNINTYLNKYETLLLNNYNFLDNDMLWYPLLINWEITEDFNKINNIKYQHYFFSCYEICPTGLSTLTKLKNEYKYISIKSQKAEGYLFFLKEKNLNNIYPVKSIYIDNKYTDNFNDFIKKFYNKLRIILKIPQI